MRNIRNTQRISVGKLKGTNNLGDLDVPLSEGNIKVDLM
jgi:hypothetical protein